MAKTNVVWLLNPDCPDEWLGRFGREKEESKQVRLLVEAHENGWIEILGQTKQSARNLAAVLQEFMSVKVITDEPRYGDRGDDAK